MLKKALDMIHRPTDNPSAGRQAGRQAGSLIIAFMEAQHGNVDAAPQGCYAP